MYIGNVSFRDVIIEVSAFIGAILSCPFHLHWLPVLPFQVLLVVLFLNPMFYAPCFSIRCTRFSISYENTDDETLDGHEHSADK